MSETFAKVAKSRYANEQQQQQPNEHDSLADTANGAANAPANLPQLNSDNSRDIFDVDDDYVAETQEFPDESNDSGETVDIPLYVKGNDDAVNGERAESQNQSEFFQVHPESQRDEPLELQSQAVFSHLDQSLVHELWKTTVTNNGRVTGASISAARDTASIESNPNNANTQMDDASDKHSVDRSASTTPDLDFIVNCAQKDNTTTETTTAAGNGNIDDETQMLTQSIFQANTQRMERAESPDTTCAGDDICDAAPPPMPIFKVPAVASSTPRIVQGSKSLVSDDDVYEAATQAQEDDLFNAATQMLPIVEKSASAKNPVNMNQNDKTTDNGPHTSMEHNKSGKISI